jgi:PAS domain S-box-containing protein
MYYFVIFIATPLFVLGCVFLKRKFDKIRKKLQKQKVETEYWKSKAVRKSETNNSIEHQKRIELLSIVATQTENAIMIMDTDGNIEWLNDGFTRMYGYTYQEFIAARGSNIRQTSFSGVIDERLRKCKTTGEPVFYDAPNTTRDGREIWTHTTLTPIFNDEGAVIYLATIDTDIDRRKSAADVLLKELALLRERLNRLAVHQEKMTEVISELLRNQEKSSREVDATHQIVEFINEVSDRIKIMGLNASIEAAGIGQNGENKGAGAGFRVLSGEIIKMSEETKKQSWRIGNVVKRLSTSFSVITQSKTEVENETRQYLENISQLEEGLLKVEEVAETLNE